MRLSGVLDLSTRLRCLVFSFRDIFHHGLKYAGLGGEIFIHRSGSPSMDVEGIQVEWVVSSLRTSLEHGHSTTGSEMPKVEADRAALGLAE